MNKKTIVILVIIVLLGIGGYVYLRRQPQEQVIQEIGQETAVSEGYVDVSPAEAKRLIDEDPDLVVLDVSPKYGEGHLPRAINYYAGDGSLEEAIPSLDKNVTYLVYCHVDSVSIQGAQMLIDAGFENVYRLEGNYAAWVTAGYEIEK